MNVKVMLTAGLLAAGTLVFVGCDNDRNTTPPDTTPNARDTGERVGDAVDRGMDRTGDAIKEGADRTGDAARRAAEKTGNAVDNAANSATTRPVDRPVVP